MPLWGADGQAKNQLGERRLGELAYFLGDIRLGDNIHLKKDVSPKDGLATKTKAVCITVCNSVIRATIKVMGNPRFGEP